MKMEVGYDNIYSQVVDGLRRIGYQDALLQQDYKFVDWFSDGNDERQVAAAAFGQTPVSYETACIGVARANGICEQGLINQCRALGAPVILEIEKGGIREWMVSREENRHGLVGHHPIGTIQQMFANRAADWRPEPLLRAKNIGAFHWTEQLGLFTGLVPELEEHIQEKLDPLLRQALSETKAAYKDSAGRSPNPAHLFKLVFWILTAKVFYDRKVPGFSHVARDPDDLLAAVARHYRANVPTLLNRQARRVAAEHIWAELDFRNLSVEVLAQIWSTTLVDNETKRRLSIHRTPRTIVRYILERVPFRETLLGDDKRIVLEPCSGSGVFLIGAMNILRQNLFGADPQERHAYFVQHLAGIEQDPFAVEINRLALTLADFPNPDGWDVVQKDVFERGTLSSYVKRAGVVLCNPPFGDFDAIERRRYQPCSMQRPAELLHRILDDLHPSGVLGFVLPRNVLDGRGYVSVRERVAKRFATIELTLLPDRAFEADSEIAVLIATDPIPHVSCHVTNRKVNDDPEAWEEFEQSHKLSADHVAELGVEEAGESFAVPDLPEVWDFLINYPILGDSADFHRGIEWKDLLTRGRTETGHRLRLVRKDAAAEYRRGVAPRTKFNVFEVPEMAYLSFRPEDQRGAAWQSDWSMPKAILNKAARSRGAWRMAAFPDTEGIACYQTYIGVWAKSPEFDEWLLSAILNSPVANAFVATREGKTDITVETLRLVPLPYFTESQRQKLRSLIRQYQDIGKGRPLMTGLGEAEQTLKQIDAVVLDGYRMPPRLERKLLEFFRGHTRPTSHHFGDYFPADCDVYFSLSEFLSPDFSAATSGELLRRMAHS